CGYALVQVPATVTAYIYLLSLHDALPIFDSDDEELREVAAYGLADIGDPRGQDYLLEVAAGDDHGDARRALAALRLTANADATQDRKSTRLNSSHVKISYAVFCLKKKDIQ